MIIILQRERERERQRERERERERASSGLAETQEPFCYHLASISILSSVSKNRYSLIPLSSTAQELVDGAHSAAVELYRQSAANMRGVTLPKGVPDCPLAYYPCRLHPLLPDNKLNHRLRSNYIKSLAELGLLSVMKDGRGVQCIHCSDDPSTQPG